MVRIMLVRHGETDWNREGRIQGQTDIPLNARGLKQAKDVARKLASLKIEHIFSSPLERALRTAQEISDHKGIGVIVDERLREMSQGEWDGKRPADLAATSPKYAAFQRDPLLTTPPGGESVVDVFRRVRSFLAERVEPLGGNIVIAAHKVILAVIATAVNAHLDKRRGTSIRALGEEDVGENLHNLWTFLPHNAEIRELQW